MGKDKKKDAEKAAVKKATKAAKQDAKASKSAKKSARKSGAVDSDEEDIDVIMAKQAQEDAKRTAVTVDALPGAATPRINFTLTSLPAGGAHGAQELLLFGGEYFDGDTNTCYNDVYRITLDTKAASAGAGLPSAPCTGSMPLGPQAGFTWRSVNSPNSPGPRCSHQATLVDNNKALLVFGGEFATANQFYHWGDTWRLDLSTNRWSPVPSNKSPGARSGHRMTAWRAHVVLFGGFYQTLTRDAWFGDTWLFDTRAGGGWTEVTFPTLLSLPAARSGMQLLAVPSSDMVVLHGGYSEVRVGAHDPNSGLPGVGGGGKKGSKTTPPLLLRKTRSVYHTDTWILRMGPVATGGSPTWERVRTTGVPPSPRVGFSMVPFKDKLLLFGGVHDKDEDVKGEVVKSEFYNDLYSYDVSRRRWYKLDLRAGGAGAAAGAAARKERRKTARSASAHGADKGEEEEVDLGEGEDEDEDEDEALAAASRSKKQGGKGQKPRSSSCTPSEAQGRSGYYDAEGEELDDTAFYVYIDGKLVKVEADEEEEGEGEGVGARDGGSGPTLAPREVETVAGQAQAAEPVVVEKSVEPIARPALPITPIPAPAPATALAPAPVGRMRAGMWVEGHFLHVYGGLHETGSGSGSVAVGGAGPSGTGRMVPEVDVTLDDVWRLDMRSRHAWECLAQGSWRAQAWKGEEEEEEEEEEGDEEGDEEEDEDDDDEDEDDEDEDEADGKGKATSKAEGEVEEDGAGVSRHGRSQMRGTREAMRVRALQDKLGLEDPATTPAPGERLASFFARTVDTWVATLLSTPGSLPPNQKVTGKDIRRRAFLLARPRYEAVWPLLEELHELEQMQREAEEEAAQQAAAAKAKAKGRGGGAGKGGRQ